MMPTYCFACPTCHSKKEVLRPIARRNDPVACDLCDIARDEGGPAVQASAGMVRDITAEHVWSENIDYHQPVFSNSMGVAPKQVRQAQALHPHIKYQRDGSIRIDSPAEYRRVRRDLGFVDQRPR